MTERLTIFTLQGLGNSLLALPAVEQFQKHFNITLYLMNREALSFYSRLNLNFETAHFNKVWNIFLDEIKPASTAVSLYPNWKRELLALSRTKAGRKISFLDPRYPLSRFVRSQKIVAEPIHDIENNANIFAHLNLPYEPPDLSRFFPGAKKKQISIHPTASTVLKRYPKSFWSMIIRHFLNRGYSILLFSGNSPDEKSYLTELIQETGASDNLSAHCGLPLYEVAQHLNASEIFIGLDSALMHLSALLNVFTIGLWSYADYRRIHPYGNQAHVYLPQAGSLERAEPADIIAITEGVKKPDFSIQPKFVNAVNFYTY